MITASVNDTMGEVRIPIVDNVILEESENFTVTMVGTNPRIVVDTTPTTITIIDDEGKRKCSQTIHGYI